MAPLEIAVLHRATEIAGVISRCGVEGGLCNCSWLTMYGSGPDDIILACMLAYLLFFLFNIFRKRWKNCTVGLDW